MVAGFIQELGVSFQTSHAILEALPQGQLESHYEMRKPCCHPRFSLQETSQTGLFLLVPEYMLGQAPSIIWHLGNMADAPNGKEAG